MLFAEKFQWLVQDLIDAHWDELARSSCIEAQRLLRNIQKCG
jgi:hypothetical protein